MLIFAKCKPKAIHDISCRTIQLKENAKSTHSLT